MISGKKVQELGDALADIYRQYPADDLRKILEYGLEHRQMLGYPHEVADMLETFARKLREFPDNRDSMVERWKRESKTRHAN
jgi:hypothetical protein